MVSTVDNAKNVNEAHEGVVKCLLNTGSIIAAFVKLGKGKVIFLQGQHTKMKAKAKIKHWVLENT